MIVSTACRDSGRYPEGSETTSAEELAEIFLERGLTLSVAESCTGGMLGSAITSVSGSSGYFLGGIVTYSNGSKTEILGIPKDSIDRTGAVSEETAKNMASCTRALFKSDISVSITGIAGPNGGTPSKPVGLVWIGVSSNVDVFAEKFDFSGCRDDVRNSAVLAAVGLVADYVLTRFIEF
ncbi:MAG: nicotinamide-nucleotide amidohydrolase family protein [Candidatus Methanoplasma sp.]|nr:nicotinamide-nucleotide amidohydrolase family protein [Candidatus Methanoplasma sp.]